MDSRIDGHLIYNRKGHQNVLWKGQSYVQVSLGPQDIFLEKHDTLHKTIQRDYRSKIWEKTQGSINSRKDKPWSIHTMEYITQKQYWKNKYTKQELQYNSTYIKFKNKQQESIVIKVRGWLSLAESIYFEGVQGYLLGCRKCFISWLALWLDECMHNLKFTRFLPYMYIFPNNVLLSFACFSIYMNRASS